MRLLLDTHYVIWLVSARTVLNAREKEMLASPGNELRVSTISIWELRIKYDAERRRGRAGSLAAGDAIASLRESGTLVVAPAAEDYAAALSPSLDHTDSFDEMLLVHAQQLGARLLTRDTKLRDHPLALVP